MSITMESTKSQQVYHLVTADYAVFVLMLLISVLIGLYYKFTGGRQRTTAEYLLADSSMSVLPVAFSLMASFMSAITLLGVSAEIYTYGTQFVVINFSYIIGTPLAAFVFLPVFYRLKLTSIYEYLEMRFNRSVRVVASSIFMVQMIFYMAIVLYAPALALSAVTGTSKWTSIISVGAVCTLYCTIGGIKAVLWTDVFQSILMFMAMFIIITKGTIDVGGLDIVFERAQNGSRLELFNLDPDPTTRHTVWSLGLGGVFIFLSIYGVNQTQIQRLLTVKSLKQSQTSLFISWILTSLLSFVTALTGLVIYANFWKDDPINCGYITKPDQLLPYYTVSKLSSYPGVPGLIIAGIFSGSLSTVSSFVNSLSAVTLEDYLKPIFKKNSLFKKYEIVITKILAFFYGCLCICLTYLADKMAGLLQASLTLFGVVGGPLLMLFTVGMCFRITNSNGAMSGFIVSLIFSLWIGFANLLYGKRSKPLPALTDECLNDINHTNMTTYFRPSSQEHISSNFVLYNLSYLWLAGLSWLIGLVISLAVSYCTNPKFAKLNNKVTFNEATPESIPIPDCVDKQCNSIPFDGEKIYLKEMKCLKVDASLLTPLFHGKHCNGATTENVPNENFSQRQQHNGLPQSIEHETQIA